MIEVRFCRLHDDAQLPTKGSSEAAAFDLRALEAGTLPGMSLDTTRPVKHGVKVCAHRQAVRTGLAPILPAGYQMSIRPRSGHGINSGVTVINTPGTVDPDYHGEIKILLVNLSDQDFHWKKGDRLAQAIFEKIETVEVKEASRDELDQLIEAAAAAGLRGAKGFGSTGQ